MNSPRTKVAAMTMKKNNPGVSAHLPSYTLDPKTSSNHLNPVAPIQGSPPILLGQLSHQRSIRRDCIHRPGRLPHATAPQEGIGHYGLTEGQDLAEA